MRRVLVSSTLTLIACSAAVGDEPAAQQVLRLRYALLTVERGDDEPAPADTQRAAALERLRADWNPAGEEQQLAQLFAQRGLRLLGRDSRVLPASGGRWHSVHLHEGTLFELRFDVEPLTEETAFSAVQLSRDGVLVSAPGVHAPWGDSVVVASRPGPEEPFLFLLVAVDRASPESFGSTGPPETDRRIFTLDDDQVVAPRALFRRQAAYSEEARRKRIQGTVRLRLLIDERGQVEEVEVIEGLPEGLSEAAAAAVSEWRFTPALRAGEPVRVWFDTTISFRLQ